MSSAPTHTDFSNGSVSHTLPGDWRDSSTMDPAKGDKAEIDRFASPTTLPDVEHREHADNLTITSSGRVTKASSQLEKTRSALGLHPSAPVAEEHDLAEHSELWWSKLRLTLREPFAEFFGVFIMVLFGDGSVAQVLLSAGETAAPGGNGYGAYQSISWG